MRQSFSKKFVERQSTDNNIVQALRKLREIVGKLKKTFQKN